MFEAYKTLQGFDEETDFMPIISVNDDQEFDTQESYSDLQPILALKNTVLFPGIVIPITVGRDKSIRAIKQAYEDDRVINVIAQRNFKVEDPQREDLFEVGTIARILKLLKMPDGTTTAILQGRKRSRLLEMARTEPYLEGRIQELDIRVMESELEFEALIATILDLAKQIVELSPNIPSEAILMLQNINNPEFLLNFIASNLDNKIEQKQHLLEINDLKEKANEILRAMNEELQLLELRDQIENRVRSDIEKQQRDYYLNQQLKRIQEELGHNPQEEEIQHLIERSREKEWPGNVLDVFNKEIQKIRRMNPQVAEYGIQLNYLELLLDLPWNELTKDRFDLRKVKKVLDKDHSGLEKVKDRILEHLAVLKLKGDLKSPILCLVGPPGVGKTSLGRSVANALGRKFVRMSLGGLHDESEIRGHRKTYIGAMPGRIIQSLKRAGASNPVFILDEIDKLGKDFRGDPSSALLEVLDPEQNTTFYDNYLELEYDLSKVLFIATANTLSAIQPALLDRMEIIHISGYSTEEKVEIAKKHLVPKQVENHGLDKAHVKLKVKTLQAIIQDYTRESGVRELDRQIAGVMRNVAKKVAMEEAYDPAIKVKDLRAMLGPAKYNNRQYHEVQSPGVAVGLAWTQVGGEILFVEGALSPGTGKITLTGNLGDVMKESASTALSFIKAHSESLAIASDLFKERDVHLHVPEGAIPKDGPSAGITMLTALTSIFTGRPVKPFLAMTGEITLRGKVLPVGGIKEKILAAKRAGLTEIILCKENQKNVEEVRADYLKGLTFHYVDQMQEVIQLALLD